MLIEAAYTFLGSRKLGVMGDGLHQLLGFAANEGATSALTYVAAYYPPSIRGCANVGFRLDHLRLDRRRVSCTAQRSAGATIAGVWRPGRRQPCAD